MMKTILYRKEDDVSLRHRAGRPVTVAIETNKQENENPRRRKLWLLSKNRTGISLGWIWFQRTKAFIYHGGMKIMAIIVNRITTRHLNINLGWQILNKNIFYFTFVLINFIPIRWCNDFPNILWLLQWSWWATEFLFIAYTFLLCFKYILLFWNIDEGFFLLFEKL